MKLKNLREVLDKEFNILNNRENLLDFAITDENKKFINDDFLERKTGLMIKGSDEIKKVYSVVFITDEVLNKICNENNCLIFTHHHFDYYEDERGLQPVSKKQISKIIEAGNSIYVAHAALDTHPQFGTSISLAELCGIKVEKLFFDYFGAPAALIGTIDPIDFSSFAETIRKKLQRPYLTLNKFHNVVNKIGVAAGGGDIPELLQYVYDDDCDTLLTGTIENRWDIPFVQEANKKFHELNSDLKINLIGGTHYGTERPAMINIKKLFNKIGIDCEFCEDENLLNEV